MCIAKQSKQLMKRCVGDADLGVVMRAWFLRIFHDATSGRRGGVLCSHLFHEKKRPKGIRIFPRALCLDVGVSVLVKVTKTTAPSVGFVEAPAEVLSGRRGV